MKDRRGGRIVAGATPSAAGRVGRIGIKLPEQLPRGRIERGAPSRPPAAHNWVFPSIVMIVGLANWLWMILSPGELSCQTIFPVLCAFEAQQARGLGVDLAVGVVPKVDPVAGHHV